MELDYSQATGGDTIAFLRGLLLIVVIILAGRGLAYGDKRADSLTAKGKTLAELGDFHGALTMFKQAYAIEPGAKEQCNVGGAYFKLKRWPEAYLYLDRCLQAPAKQDDQAYLRVMTSVLKKVEKNVGNGEFAKVSFDVVPSNAKLQVSALPGDVYFGSKQKLWLPTGSHRVSARAEGFETSESVVDVTKGQSSTLRIEMSKTIAVVPKVPKPLEGHQSVVSDRGNTTGPSQTNTLKTPSPAHRDNSSSSKVPAIAALSLGGVSLAGGIVYFISASNASEEAEGLLVTDPKRDELKDRFGTRRIVSYSLFGVGAVATILGTYWMLGSESGGSTQTAFRASFSQGGAQLSGQWKF